MLKQNTQESCGLCQIVLVESKTRDKWENNKDGQIERFDLLIIYKNYIKYINDIIIIIKNNILKKIIHKF